MPCVLVVEDEPDVRELLEVMLQAEGYDTLAAPNGAAALDAMQRRKPCVVLLDMMMPVMDGWTFRERQLANPPLADVPVICVTAMYDPARVSETLHVPCLEKPVDMDALLDRVRRACSRGPRNS